MHTVTLTVSEYRATLLGAGNLWERWSLRPAELRAALVWDAEHLMRRGARPELHALGGNRSRLG